MLSPAGTDSCARVETLGGEGSCRSLQKRGCFGQGPLRILDAKVPRCQAKSRASVCLRVPGGLPAG